MLVEIPQKTLTPHAEAAIGIPAETGDGGRETRQVCGPFGGKDQKDAALAAPVALRRRLTGRESPRVAAAIGGGVVPMLEQFGIACTDNPAQWANDGATIWLCGACAIDRSLFNSIHDLEQRSLTPKSDHRIHFRRAPRRNPAGQ
jgi:hypothetical protein